MFRLLYQSYVFDKSQNSLPPLETLPEGVQQAITFCTEWLEGKESFLQPTSGTTGAPQELLLSRQQLEDSAKSTGAFFDVDANFSLLCCLNPAFIGGKMMLVRALVWDCEVTLVEPSADPLAGLEESFSLVAMVPLQVATSLANADRMKQLRSLKALLVGGAPLPYAVQEDLSTQGIAAWQTFGMTETVSHFALAKIGTDELVYKCLPGVEIGLDEEGNLWVQSPMSGKERIATRDKIELRSKNTFVWLGRADFVVNSGGIKLFPEQLEKKINTWMSERYPGVSYFFFGEADDWLGQRLVLYVEGVASQFNLEALEEGLKKLLGKFEVPKKINILPRFTYTETGKINRPVTAKQP
jgi:O-succinylbenzoic acid--CoA ligase